MSGLPGLSQQVSGVAAFHRAGQTFITFREPHPEAAPAALSIAGFRQLQRQLAVGEKIRYRVYRSARPITRLDGLAPVAEAPPLTAWNVEYYGDPGDRVGQPALRYVIDEGQPPLAPGTGVCVFNPPEAGAACYAVTVLRGGKEELEIGAGNSMATAVEESVGQGAPVLQRVERPAEWQYVRNPTLHYYVRWESPPNCSVMGKPMDYVVAVPPTVARPPAIGLHLHCWGGSLNGGYGWWYQAEQGHILVAANQVPYDWWTGYHERYWLNSWERAPRDPALWREGVVRPYSQTRMLSFLDWAAARWNADASRTHVAGSSMGGSGALMFAIRHPDRIAWATGWVGVHVPERSPTFRSSYAQVYGEPGWQARFEDGTPTWEHFNDALYLRRHARVSVGLLCFSNGKNDGGIGWPQAVEFHRALQETRQPHIFVWGQRGHGQRAALPGSLEDRHMPLDLRITQSLPAFSACSLDENPGSGDPKEGDPEGQSNLYLVWSPTNIVDTPDRWEMSANLVPKAPREDCVVNVTPRRLQRLQLLPGQELAWTNFSLPSGEAVQKGRVVVDRDSLATLERIRVSRAGNRVVLAR